MRLFSSTKQDPLVNRQRALKAQIEAIQAQIRELNVALEPRPCSPSVAVTPPADVHPETTSPQPEPVFEQVNHGRMAAPADASPTPAQFNELGVRKYDLAAVWRRFFRHVSGPPASNPRLISYLAAGSIQGLRPLRYEKRVARNRVVVLTVILGAILWGLFAVFRQ